jgi:hypothetical protein
MWERTGVFVARMSHLRSATGKLCLIFPETLYRPVSFLSVDNLCECVALSSVLAAWLFIPDTVT